jgi:hypothetical protein
MSAFLSPATVQSIFGTDLFIVNEEDLGKQNTETEEELQPARENWEKEKESRVNRFLGVIGLNGTKPFECIGTAHESRAALQLALRQRIIFIAEEQVDQERLLESIPWLLKNLTERCGVDLNETLRLSHEKDNEVAIRIVINRWLSENKVP